MRHTRGDPAEGPSDERCPSGDRNLDDVLGTRRSHGGRGGLVRDVMSAPVGPCLALDDAVHRMGDRGIGALPVVDRGHVAGILTQSDIVAPWPAGGPHEPGAMNCVCGHPHRDHVPRGRCRVPDCPCEMFRPGDTLRNLAAAPASEGRSP